MYKCPTYESNIMYCVNDLDHLVRNLTRILVMYQTCHVTFQLKFFLNKFTAGQPIREQDSDTPSICTWSSLTNTQFLVYLELDFYCLCSPQKSILKLIFADWKSSPSNLIFQTWFFKLGFSKIKYRWIGHQTGSMICWQAVNWWRNFSGDRPRDKPDIFPGF